MRPRRLALHLPLHLPLRRPRSGGFGGFGGFGLGARARRFRSVGFRGGRQLEVPVAPAVTVDAERLTANAHARRGEREGLRRLIGGGVLLQSRERDVGLTNRRDHPAALRHDAVLLATPLQLGERRVAQRRRELLHVAAQLRLTQ